MMAALNFLADGASRRILFLSFIWENFTTIRGTSLAPSLFRDSKADTLFGKRCTFENCIFSISAGGNRRVFVINERTRCSVRSCTSLVSV